jgi:hypothetical protein
MKKPTHQCRMCPPPYSNPKHDVNGERLPWLGTSTPHLGSVRIPTLCRQPTRQPRQVHKPARNQSFDITLTLPVPYTANGLQRPHPRTEVPRASRMPCSRRRCARSRPAGQAVATGQRSVGSCAFAGASAVRARLPKATARTGTHLATPAVVPRSSARHSPGPEFLRPCATDSRLRLQGLTGSRAQVAKGIVATNEAVKNPRVRTTVASRAGRCPTRQSRNASRLSIAAMRPGSLKPRSGESGVSEGQAAHWLARQG